MQDGNMLVEDSTNGEAVKKMLGEFKDSPIRKTYAYHRPSVAGIDKIAKLRRAFSEITDLIEAIAPSTRERSVALTNLEQAAMWAIKSVVCNDPESVAE